VIEQDGARGHKGRRPDDPAVALILPFAELLERIKPGIKVSCSTPRNSPAADHALLGLLRLTRHNDHARQ
jgi:hypothetical protein